VEGKPAAKALDRAGIELNFNTVPYDPRKPWSPSGIRLGTPALTTRGLTEEQMPAVAGWIDAAVTAASKQDLETLDRIAAEVADLLAGFPMPGWAPTP
jgi:glycine hydroxymethyltransferase